jgi:hypothetical protein
MNPANAWLLLTCRSRGVDFSPSGFGALKPADVALAMQGLPRERFLLGMAKLAGDLSVLRELESLIWVRVIDMAASGAWQIRRGSQVCRRLAALALYESLNGERCIVCNGKGAHDEPPIRTPWDVQSADARHLAQSLRRLRRLEWRMHMLSAQSKPRTPADIRRIKNVLRWIERLQMETDALPGPSACESCNGRGTRKVTDTHRAWLTGLSRSQWHRSWAARYEPLRLEVEGWVSDCLSHVRRRFVIEGK